MMEYINFPLLLVIATFGALFIWLFDIAFLKKKRELATASLQAELPRWQDAASDDGQRFQEAMSGDLGEPVAVEYARSLFPVLALVLILRSFIVEPFQIPSGSMIPTLEVGDFILVNKFTYGLRLPVVRTKFMDMNAPKRGDVMVFFPPHKKQYFIKRVIGLPGDTIEVTDKVIYVNGEKVPQELQAALPPIRPQEHVLEETIDGVSHAMRIELNVRQLPDYKGKVEPGHYFMMGDNRDRSQDSRVWGQVPEQNIVGKAFAIWMHWPTFFSLPSFDRSGGIQ